MSPDGSTFLYRSNENPDFALIAVNVDTGEDIGSANQLSGSYEIVYSDDGDRVFVGNWSGTVYVYDGKTHELVDTLTRAQGGGVLDVAPNGNFVATATFDNTVRVQTLDTHELALEITFDVKIENIEWLNEDHLMVILPDGSVLVFTIDSEELEQIARSRLTRGFTEEECATYDLDPCSTLEDIRNG